MWRTSWNERWGGVLDTVLASCSSGIVTNRASHIYLLRITFVRKPALSFFSDPIFFWQCYWKLLLSFVVIIIAVFYPHCLARHLFLEVFLKGLFYLFAICCLWSVGKYLGTRLVLFCFLAERLKYCKWENICEWLMKNILRQPDLKACLKFFPTI